MLGFWRFALSRSVVADTSYSSFAAVVRCALCCALIAKVSGFAVPLCVMCFLVDSCELLCRMQCRNREAVAEGLFHEGVSCESE